MIYSLSVVFFLLFISIIAYYYYIPQSSNLCGKLESFNVVLLDAGRNCSNIDFEAFVLLCCWRKKTKSTAISINSRLIAGMRILNFTLAPSLVLHSNYVELNLGPFMSPTCCRNTSSCGSCTFLADDNNSFEYG